MFHETLESRRMMTVTATDLTAGVLTVTGSDQSDEIFVYLNGSGKKVVVEDYDAMAGASTFYYFNANSVSEVRILAKGGNDGIYCSTLAIPTHLEGGAGNDWLYGGGADCTIYGGSGNDHVVGGDGDDWLFGEDGDDEVLGLDGDDVLYGSAGDDYLRGDEGEDFMYGGADDDVLNALDGETNDHLSGGSGSDTAMIDAWAILYGPLFTDAYSGIEAFA
jgi:Ca2+-binding RTX toxin-like protein